MSTWRGSTDIKDRFFAVLAYTLPMCAALPFASAIFSQLPFLNVLRIPLTPTLFILGLFNSSFRGFGSLILFFILLLAVVRNYKICHFIRFNTMQAILIDIFLYLLSLVFLNPSLAGALPRAISSTIQSTIFVVAFAACIYSIAECIRGNYPELPVISPAVYNQVP